MVRNFQARGRYCRQATLRGMGLLPKLRGALQVGDLTISRMNKGLLAALILVGIMVVVLAAMGREWICKCGTAKLWHGVVVSSENSQHLSDWYTPSHVIHGFLFFGLGWLIMRRANWGWRLALATLIEIPWEIVENTDAIINRYREVTISLDYNGDSIVNSAADVAAMFIGFALAARLPIWVTVVLAVGLVYPMDWVVQWQTKN